MYMYIVLLVPSSVNLCNVRRAGERAMITAIGKIKHAYRKRRNIGDTLNLAIVYQIAKLRFQTKSPNFLRLWYYMTCVRVWVCVISYAMLGAV